MLNVKKDRLDYGELLMPPQDYTLVRGIATTYSLDLHTLLAVPVALFYAKTLEGDFTEENRYDVLDAIQQTDQVIKVFCQKGKIKVPKKHNHLFAFLEDVVVEVQPDNAFSSFHPKLWVLRYEKEEEAIYRLLVLSRNLTFDRSWDVALTMEGRPGKKPLLENRKLISMLKYLHDQSLSTLDESFLSDLEKVEFDGIDSFDAFFFHPIGVNRDFQAFPNPLKSKTFDELVIITPFLDGRTLQLLKQNTRTAKSIFSRKEELQLLDPAALEGYDVYCLNKLIVEGETYDTLEESEMETEIQNLHAKVYIARIGEMYYWFVGSANASTPAFERNTEFLIELRTEEEACSPEYIKAALINEEDRHPFFEAFIPSEKTVDPETEIWSQQIRRLEYDLIDAHLSGTCTLHGNQKNYDIQINMDLSQVDGHHDFTVKLTLINSKGDGKALEFGKMNHIEVSNQRLSDLSEFVKISVLHKSGQGRSFLRKMDINLPEDRKKLILRSLIDSQEKFFQYLRFLVADDPSISEVAISTMEENGQFAMNGNTLGGGLLELPIFEQLLMAASRSPQKLRRVNDLINRIRSEELDAEQSIIPDAFIQFWQVFQALIPEK